MGKLITREERDRQTEVEQALELFNNKKNTTREIQELQAAHKQIKDAVVVEQASLDAAKKKTEEEKGRCAEIQKEIADKEEKLQSIKSLAAKVSQDVDQLKSDVESLKEAGLRLEELAATAKGATEKAKAEMSSIKTETITLEKEKGVLSSAVADLSREKAALEGEIAVLQSNVLKAMEAQKAQEDNFKQALEKYSISNLEKEYEKKMAEVLADGEATKATLESEIKVLNSEVTSHKKEVEKLLAQKESVTSQTMSIKIEANNQMKELEAKIKAHKKYEKELLAQIAEHELKLK